MKSNSGISRFAAFGASVTLSATMVAHAVYAHAEQRGPVQRIVQGKVVDSSNAVAKGAVVYLKDDHTLSVKSFITDDAGAYRFGQLASGTDYELWAESNGRKSTIKTISSFDNKNEFNIDLKLNK